MPMTKSVAKARAPSSVFFLRFEISLLNFSASSAASVVTVPTSFCFSARSAKKTDTSRVDLPNSSSMSRPLLPSSAKPLRATAVWRMASAGSRVFSFSMLRLSALSAASASEPGLASFNSLLNLMSALPTVSKLVPVRLATSSKALMFSILLPVASFRSFRASMPSMVALANDTMAPMLRPAASCARPPRTRLAALFMSVRRPIMPSMVARVRSSALRMILTSVAMV